eukprot:12853327-Ditylum_brightwellii.AAC.1
MAAKHFFEKRHGKRFRPTIVQLMAKTVAAVAPETNYGELSNTSTESHNGEHAGDIDNNGLPGGVAGWEWSGASKIE